nr:hypothetical protein [Thetidibacter halocola]
MVGEAHRLLAEHVDDLCDTLVFSKREGPQQAESKPLKEDVRHREFDPSEEDDTDSAERNGEDTLERKIAALERLVSETDDRAEWDAEPEPANRRALFQHSPPPALAWQTATSRTEHAEKSDKAAVAARPPGDGGARPPSIAREVTEDKGQAHLGGPESPQPVVATEKRDTMDTGPATAPEQRATPTSRRDDAATTIAPPAHDRKKDDSAIDLLAEDGLLSIDEEALREMVADIVRQELQGALGERITRNVRKLVRREIHRVLVSKDFD